MKAFTILFILFFISGCNNINDTFPDSDKFILKSYKVNPKYDDEISQAMNRLLNTRPIVSHSTEHNTSSTTFTKDLGQVHVASSGLIIVKAPKSIQKGIPEIIAKIDQAKSISNESLKLSINIFAGVKSNEASYTESQELTKKHPSYCFKLVDSGSTNIYTGEPIKLRGLHYSFKGDLITIGQGKYIGDIRLDSRGGLRASTKGRMLFNLAQNTNILESMIPIKNMDQDFSKCGISKSHSSKENAKIIYQMKISTLESQK